MTQTIVRSGVTIRKNSITVRRGKTFMTLASNPQKWEYRGVCFRMPTVNHCDLCGTELIYKHGLHEVGGKARTLWVGCECVKWYFESWQPNGIEQALLRVKEAQQREHKKHIAKKLEEFNVAYPAIYSYLLGVNRRYSYRYSSIKCDVIDSFSGMYLTRRVATSKFRSSLKQKGYLNKIEMESLQSALEYGQLPADMTDDFVVDFNNVSK